MWKEGPQSQLDQIYEGRDDTERLSVFEAARAAAWKARQSTTTSSSNVPRASDWSTSEMGDFEDYIWDEWDGEQCTAGSDGGAVKEAERSAQTSSGYREVPPADSRRTSRVQGPPGYMMPPPHHLGDSMTTRLPAEVTVPSSTLHSSYTQSCSFFTAGTVK